MRKKVLVCGASGFIGRNLFEGLLKREDLDVYGTYFSRKPVDDHIRHRLSFIDLRDQTHVNWIGKEKFDVIINAAATTGGMKDAEARKFDYITDNIVMNTLLLRGIYEHQVPHFIFLSCSVLYPMDIGKHLREEDTDWDKIHPDYDGFAEVKILGEDLCRNYAKAGRTKFTVIRHSNIYGPHDKFDLEKGHMFGATVKKVMDTPEGGIVEVWGNGQEKRDLLFVSDFVGFVEKAMDKQEDNFDIFNVGAGYSVSVEYIVKKIIRASDKHLIIKFGPEKPSRLSVNLDISKARKKLGWMPMISLENGIYRTLWWYAMNWKQ